MPQSRRLRSHMPFVQHALPQYLVCCVNAAHVRSLVVAVVQDALHTARQAASLASLLLASASSTIFF
jgi:hypothetical protein